MISRGHGGMSPKPPIYHKGTNHIAHYTEFHYLGRFEAMDTLYDPYFEFYYKLVPET